jgi:8-oxo-dGTP diphosphatase
MNADPEKQRPAVGAAAVVWRDETRSQLLLGLGHSIENRDRIYAVPGGHWHSGETLSEAARREAAEEAGIDVCKMRLISVYEFFNQEKNKSYVTIGFECFLAGGEPRVMEPEKKVNWGWYPPEEALRLPLFIPDAVLISRAVSGIIYEPSD